MMDIYSESGRIKSLEKKFLTTKQIQSLIEAKNFGEILSILEKSFYKIPSTISTVDEIIQLFEKEREKFYQEIERFYPTFLKVFLLKNDFFNLKIIVEGKENFVHYGNLPGQILKRAIEEKKIEVPGFLKKAVEIVKGNKEIKEKLLLLKNEYYNQLYKLLSGHRSEFIENYGKIEIDFANLSTFILLKKEETKFNPEFFVKNGKIGIEKFKNEEVLLKSLKSEYKILQIPINEENFEIERYRVIMHFIKRGRVIPYGIDTIFAYLVAREIEIETVRRLIIGKFYNIDENILKNWAIPPYQWGEK